MAKKTKTETVTGADGSDLEVHSLEDGQNLVPGVEPPPPPPELWEVTRTFAQTQDKHRTESEAMEEDRPAGFIGRFSNRVAQKRGDISADCAEDAIRVGCDILDREAMGEEEFASMFPGGEVITSVKAKRQKVASST